MPKRRKLGQSACQNVVPMALSNDTKVESFSFTEEISKEKRRKARMASSPCLFRLRKKLLDTVTTVLHGRACSY